MRGFYVDVREQSEWDAGHLEGAYHLPLSRLLEGYIPDDLPTDRPLLLYCRSGQRSQVAKSLLQSKYPLCESLDEGYDELQGKK